LVEAAAQTRGIVYIRTSRPKTPVLYSNEEYFPVGQSKTLRAGAKDAVTVVAAGVTLHEALKAHELLAREGLAVRVIDLYSIKPIDVETLRKAAEETRGIVTVEDHSVCGGLGEAVAAAVAGRTPGGVRGIRGRRRSGKPAELMPASGIDAGAIASAVRRLA